MGRPLCRSESPRVSPDPHVPSHSILTRVLGSDEIIKAAEKNPQAAAPLPMPAGVPGPGPNGRPAPVSLRDPGPAPAQQQMLQRAPSAQAGMPPPQNRPPQGYPAVRAQGPPPPQGYMPSPGQPRQGVPVASSVGSASRSPMPQQQAQQATRRF